MSTSIDLNADLGESFGVYRYGADEELIPLVSSVNIACGWHGGDPATIRKAVSLAKKNGVTIGAHPGYPDLMGFGRRYMALSAEGVRVSYVKPHGALYNAAAKDASLAEAIGKAIILYDPGLALLCPAGSAMEKVAQRMGIPVAGEFFADRAYRDDGSLVPRTEKNAVLSDPEEIISRVLSAVKEGKVITDSGNLLPVSFVSVCLHGDNPKAVLLAGAISKTLKSCGIRIKAFAGTDNGK